MEQIRSRDNARVKHACRLASSAEQRTQEGMFFAEGVRLCLDLCATLKVEYAFFTQKALDKHPEIGSLCEQAFLISEPVAQKLSETKMSQGLFCVFHTPQYTAQSLVAQNGILLCEAVSDATNVGALIRTAAGLGLGGVVLCQNSADAYSPRALRAGMGGVSHVPVLDGMSLETAVETLRELGAVFYAATLQNAKPIGELEPKSPFVLMLGNEGAGLSEQAIKYAQERVYIPMHGGVESLNVSAAGTVLMYHFRHFKGR